VKYVSQKRQTPYDFIHIWNLRNRTHEQRGKKGNPRNRLLTIENKLVVTRGEMGRGMGEVGDGH